MNICFYLWKQFAKSLATTTISLVEVVDLHSSTRHMRSTVQKLSRGKQRLLMEIYFDLEEIVENFRDINQ
jgi:hypothetical protein